MLSGRALLVVAAALSAATAGVLVGPPLRLQPVLGLVAGFDAGALAFILASLWTMSRTEIDGIRKVAARQDEGETLILALVVASCAASLAAVAAGMSPSARAQGAAEALRIVFAAVSVALAWFLVQLAFALHYAHAYYGDGDGRPVGGLAFPGNEAPDYWDFLHFSLVLGAASQTADISFTGRRLRRIGTLHTLVAFVFNAAVLALAINLMAALIST